MPGEDENLIAGVKPYLDPDEELLSACLAHPRGWGQMMASGPNVIAREIAARKQRKSRAAATDAGLVVDAPMALALTSRRLLTLKVSLTKLGRTSAVEALLGEVPIGSVQAIEVSRFGLGKRITVLIDGRKVPLEGNRGASELADSFGSVQSAA